MALTGHTERMKMRSGANGRSISSYLHISLNGLGGGLTREVTCCVDPRVSGVAGRSSVTLRVAATPPNGSNDGEESQCMAKRHRRRARKEGAGPKLGPTFVRAETGATPVAPAMARLGLDAEIILALQAVDELVRDMRKDVKYPIGVWDGGHRRPALSHVPQHARRFRAGRYCHVGHDEE
jgi:hypothetical protein